MFTGLVEALGTVEQVTSEGAGCDLTLVDVPFVSELALGDSVAINGVCLTVVDRAETSCRFQIGPETLRCTNLGTLQAGDCVNLERSLRFGDRLGGHLVQGHVDAVATIAEIRANGEWVDMTFTCPAELTAQMAPKGSIAVDGISLTLVTVTDEGFSVMLIPHTLERTTLGFKREGAPVNLETDMLAKYVSKAMLALVPRTGQEQP
jgi:riboflavin synthase